MAPVPGATVVAEETAIVATNVEGRDDQVEAVDWDALSIDLGGEDFVRTVVLCNVAW